MQKAIVVWGWKIGIEGSIGFYSLNGVLYGVGEFSNGRKKSNEGEMVEVEVIKGVLCW